MEGGGSGRAAESRARGAAGEGPGRVAGGEDGCCAVPAQINISRCPDDAAPDRVPPVLRPPPSAHYSLI